MAAALALAQVPAAGGRRPQRRRNQHHHRIPATGPPRAGKPGTCRPGRRAGGAFPGPLLRLARHELGAARGQRRLDGRRRQAAGRPGACDGKAGTGLRLAGCATGRPCLGDRPGIHDGGL
ncbi:hypothetical protein G6F22_019718 [Rhizopus arrhizus]|nr:hypothetical protein G6F22_019718 [Rhizopus arrhizus]